MKIDLRVLNTVVAFTLIAAASVVIVRTVEGGSASFVAENILSKGATSLEANSSGLTLQANAKSLLIAVPNCSVKDYPDKFFLHVFTEGDLKKTPASYTNMDFELAKEKGKEMSLNGMKVCLIEKKFPEVPIKAISVGQFTLPEGRCCEVTWSRSYRFDTSLTAR